MYNLPGASVCESVCLYLFSNIVFDLPFCHHRSHLSLQSSFFFTGVHPDSHQHSQQRDHRINHRCNRAIGRVISRVNNRRCFLLSNPRRVRQCSLPASLANSPVYNHRCVHRHSRRLDRQCSPAHSRASSRVCSRRYFRARTRAGSPVCSLPGLDILCVSA